MQPASSSSLPRGARGDPPSASSSTSRGKRRPPAATGDRTPVAEQHKALAASRVSQLHGTSRLSRGAGGCERTPRLSCTPGLTEAPPVTTPSPAASLAQRLATQIAAQQSRRAQHPQRPPPTEKEQTFYFLSFFCGPSRSVTRQNTCATPRFPHDPTRAVGKPRLRCNDTQALRTPLRDCLAPRGGSELRSHDSGHQGERSQRSPARSKE